MTAIPTDHDVVDGALRLVVELARTSVNGADGVSVSLLRHGELMTVAASDETIMEMDTEQYATGEGPCVDASLRGRWFHAESLDIETRWPSFTPRAQALGIKAILSSPLKAFEFPVGALNIYSRTASTFDVNAQETAAIYAYKASVILSDARAGVTDSQMAVRFQEALRSREIIAIAKGIVMERERVNEDDAFTRLRVLSLDGEVPLLKRAEAVMHSANEPNVAPNWDSMAELPIDELDRFRRKAGLSHGELWLRYFELGGMSTGFELEAFLYGLMSPSAHDRDVIAHAINERFVELGGNHPVRLFE